jgi:hypothetical protein
VTGQWFSLGPPVSSTNKTDRHDITEILLNGALSNIKQQQKPNIMTTEKHQILTHLAWVWSGQSLYKIWEMDFPKVNILIDIKIKSNQIFIKPKIRGP